MTQIKKVRVCECGHAEHKNGLNGCAKWMSNFIGLSVRCFCEKFRPLKEAKRVKAVR